MKAADRYLLVVPKGPSRSLPSALKVRTASCSFRTSSHTFTADGKKVLTELIKGGPTCSFHVLTQPNMKFAVFIRDLHALEASNTIA